MRSVIRFVLPLLLLLAADPAQAQDNVFTKILRNAALTNGLRPAAQLFDSTDSDLAEIGRLFFESENISLNGGISCRTCHLDQFGTTDGLPNAIGVFGKGKGMMRALSEGRIVPRNTLPFWGRGARGFRTFFWDGKIDFSEGNKISQFGATAPSDDPLVVAVHIPPLEIGEMLNDDATVSRYKQESPAFAAAIFGKLVKNLRKTEPAAMKALASKLNKSAGAVTFLGVARSIAAFIRSEFRLKDSKLQRFVFGNATLTEDELKGGLIFYGKGKCVNCHNGPHFSDFRFHAVPFPQLGFGKNGFGVDYGRFNVTFKPEDLYRFRTPPLFNVEKTAPYGHSGSLATLRDAIVSHFDPLRVVDTNSMDAESRHELFRRMAATGDEFSLIGFLDNYEVAQTEAFLKTLTFE